MRCKAAMPDLRDCAYSNLLDLGISEELWAGWEDRPVVLGIGKDKLIPMRDV
jgi:hypothetical protein